MALPCHATALVNHHKLWKQARRVLSTGLPSGSSRCSAGRAHCQVSAHKEVKSFIWFYTARASCPATMLVPLGDQLGPPQLAFCLLWGGCSVFTPCDRLMRNNIIVIHWLLIWLEGHQVLCLCDYTDLRMFPDSSCLSMCDLEFSVICTKDWFLLYLNPNLIYYYILH